MASERFRRLASRKILITGAASGMGAEIARLFVREGASLALLDYAEEPLAKIGADIDQLVIPVDVADEHAISAAVATAVRHLEGLDGVVNAAGILWHGALEQMSYPAFMDVLKVNLGGPFLVCRETLPHLRRSASATIVNIASMAALRPPTGMAAYAASKAGLVALAHALAGELGPSIRINTICPGVVRTPMIEFMWEEGGMGNEGVAGIMQLRRAGTPAEIAEVALFLTSNESSFVSMAVIAASGGQML